MLIINTVMHFVTYGAHKWGGRSKIGEKVRRDTVSVYH